MNYQWYNIGGWNNAISCVEQTLKGSKDGVWFENDNEK